MYYDIWVLKIKKQFTDKTLTKETFSKICFFMGRKSVLPKGKQ